MDLREFDPGRGRGVMRWPPVELQNGTRCPVCPHRLVFASQPRLVLRRPEKKRVDQGELRWETQEEEKFTYFLLTAPVKRNQSGAYLPGSRNKGLKANSGLRQQNFAGPRNLIDAHVHEQDVKTSAELNGNGYRRMFEDKHAL